MDASFSPTTLLDLNDDCFLDVFRYGDMFDLAKFKINQFVGLGLSFPKLVSIWFSRVQTVRNANITKFLELNPQLKSIFISESSISIAVFQSIAKYVPEIESIYFDTETEIYPSFIPKIPKCFGKLKKLKSLSFGCVDKAHTASIFCEIVAAKLPLEELSLKNMDLNRITNQEVSIHRQYNHFLDNICKLKSLRTLQLEKMKNLSSSHILDIFKQVKELSNFRLRDCVHVSFDHDLSAQNLLECIELAKKLQSFGIHGLYKIPRINIDANMCKQIVEIVDRRPEKLKLRLSLCYRGFTLEKLPPELDREYRKSVRNRNLLLLYTKT